MMTARPLKAITTTLVGFALLSSVAFVATAKSAEKERQALPLEDLQRFTAVVEHIRKYYVKPADDSQLFENAIRGMLSGLDPHSTFFSPEEFTDLKVSTSGKFGGLGIEVTMEDGFVKVIAPIDDTPASKAGVKAGDLIIQLDETPVKGLTLRQAVDIMRGERGQPIDLTIIRKGESKPLKIKLVRDIIRVQSVKTEILDDDYGYIRISQFQAKTGEDLISSIKALKKGAKKPLKGIILDLRNNPGGVLSASVKVSDAFLDSRKLEHEKLIVYTEGRLPGSKIKETATPGDVLEGAPMIVMVNGGSASASEIVAGALKDHGRAVVVGEPTFGKGSVQTVMPLNDNYGLKLTTALYYTPAGRSIQATGIQPDIVFDNITIPSVQQSELNAIKERNLRGHIETNKNKNQKAEEEADSEKPLVVRDYQLNEALNLLKGLVFMKRQG